MLSFKGVDNPAYYRLDPDDPRRYVDYTGTGNSLNMRHPHVLQLIMDSLRYWVNEMHVDGFRFDLAATLARELHDVDKLSAFFDLIQQDPVVSQVKLIAEPWDVGEGGYQVGQLPAAVVGVERQVPRRGPRLLAGRRPHRGRVRLPLHRHRRDLYEASGRTPVGQHQLRHRPRRLHRSPTSSRYDDKHNEANGEDNRDGTDDNRSWNCGVEGPTDDAGDRGPAPPPAAQPARHAAALPGRADAARRRRARAHPGAATTTPTPRTTRSPGTTGTRADADLLEFTRRLIAPAPRPPGVPPPPVVPGPARSWASEADDIEWFTPDGRAP